MKQEAQTANTGRGRERSQGRLSRWETHCRKRCLGPHIKGEGEWGGMMGGAVFIPGGESCLRLRPGPDSYQSRRWEGVLRGQWGRVWSSQQGLAWEEKAEELGWYHESQEQPQESGGVGEEGTWQTHPLGYHFGDSHEMGVGEVVGT